MQDTNEGTSGGNASEITSKQVYKHLLKLLEADTKTKRKSHLIGYQDYYYDFEETPAEEDIAFARGLNEKMITNLLSQLIDDRMKVILLVTILNTCGWRVTYKQVGSLWGISAPAVANRKETIRKTLIKSFPVL